MALIKSLGLTTVSGCLAGRGSPLNHVVHSYVDACFPCCSGIMFKGFGLLCDMSYCWTGAIIRQCFNHRFLPFSSSIRGLCSRGIIWHKLC